jgi:hypothetical protein
MFVFANVFIFAKIFAKFFCSRDGFCEQFPVFVNMFVFSKPTAKYEIFPEVGIANFFLGPLIANPLNFF